ncbi:hypothetical protein [Mucilaginibacter rubeus]|uniref:Uncharacterized protein n=1 Tax=Mucilaginibacter rubeus TaxID=2027860 RepID=A0ABX7UKU3_9SPHI|nr:hypothetical protein [Mucilaginibacter rubeus]QTE46062.1 hypothetical protein J3L19_12150 [Mucilaginibacter rubeus]QTE52660.1 hypothetical protein J3L21_12125 [Mucilaginibacter rubeus]QTE57747.1 hypothetical protein J3L23_03800 [Mucilaginibacter rubeus]QTE62792.1 hypothetical protein J3L22_30060 [Mucilaginibacter rubeus]QTF61549.1 hypothetical protein J3L20_29690 [Mucilaginibacter rubeus]
MKNHDKASLPKIQIKQVQVLNRIISKSTLKNNAGYLLTGTTTVDTTTTTTGTAF